MTDLTPAYVQSIVDHVAPRIKDDLDRVEEEVRAGFPGRSIFRHRHSVEYHLAHLAWQRTRCPRAAVPAFVQCRISSGYIHSGNVWADLGPARYGSPAGHGHGGVRPAGRGEGIADEAGDATRGRRVAPAPCSGRTTPGKAAWPVGTTPPTR